MNNLKEQLFFHQQELLHPKRLTAEQIAYHLAKVIKLEEILEEMLDERSMASRD